MTSPPTRKSPPAPTRIKVCATADAAVCPIEVAALISPLTPSTPSPRRTLSPRSMPTSSSTLRTPRPPGPGPRRPLVRRHARRRRPDPGRHLDRHRRPGLPERDRLRRVPGGHVRPEGLRQRTDGPDGTLCPIDPAALDPGRRRGVQRLRHRLAGRRRCRRGATDDRRRPDPAGHRHASAPPRPPRPRPLPASCSPRSAPCPSSAASASWPPAPAASPPAPARRCGPASSLPREAGPTPGPASRFRPRVSDRRKARSSRSARRAGSRDRRCWRSVGRLAVDPGDGPVGLRDQPAVFRRSRGRETPRPNRRGSTSSRRAARAGAVASLSDSIQGGATPALRSIRWAIAHSPAALSSSSGSRSPWYGRSSNAPGFGRLADLPLDEALPAGPDLARCPRHRVASDSWRRS